MTNEERAFLERSLADLDAEHAAGDLSDDDLAELKARYERKLAALSNRRTNAAPVAAPRRPSLVLASVAFIVVVAVGAGFLLAHYAGRREVGENISGSTPGVTGTANPALDSDLAACLDLDGEPAIDCFSTYTRSHPDDPDGFTQFGLFALRQSNAAGGVPELQDAGETFLLQALDVDPTDIDARVNLAVFYNRTGRLDDAAEQLDALEGVDIPADLQPLVALARTGLDDPTTTTIG